MQPDELTNEVKPDAPLLEPSAAGYNYQPVNIGQQAHASMVDYGNPRENVIFIAPGVSTAEVQKALVALDNAGGGILRLGIGTYIFNDEINLPSKVKLVGAGVDSTIIDFGHSGGFLSCRGAEVLGVFPGGSSMTLTEGSTAVTGVNTAFTLLKPGDLIFVPDNSENFLAEVASVTDNTNLVIKDAWPMPSNTNSNQSFFTPKISSGMAELTVKNSNSPSYAQVAVYYATNFIAQNIKSLNSDMMAGVTTSFVFYSHFSNVESSYNGGVAGQSGFIIGNTFKSVFNGCLALGTVSNDGFNIGASTELTLENCIADGNSSNGFNVNGTNINLISCRASGNDANGFYLSSALRICLMRCWSINNASAGIQNTSSLDCIILDSVLTSNGTYGINDAGTRTIIKGCTFSSNTSGYVTDSGTSSAFYNNGYRSYEVANGDNNNMDFGNDEVIRLTQGALSKGTPFYINGIINTANVKRHLLYNSAGSDMTISNLASSSAATTKIQTPTGTDQRFQGFSVAELIYNAVDEVWLLTTKRPIQKTNVLAYNSPGYSTYTAPTNLAYLEVEIIGAGGGGGGALGGAGVSAGGGGGGGGYARQLIDASSYVNLTENVFVGSGGGGGVGTATGVTGSMSWFGFNSVLSSAQATGGVGGAGSNNGALNQRGGQGGLGGVGSNGNVNSAGDAGGYGVRWGVSSFAQSGFGGGTAFGGGGDSVAETAGNGHNGQNYGGGGSGAATVGAGDKTGGSGANGAIIISEYTYV